ncbi:MAG: rod shape-determining protein [Coprococcus sp.]
MLGTTEITVITMGGIVVSKLLKVGGNTTITRPFVSLCKERHHLVIGDKTAEVSQTGTRTCHSRTRTRQRQCLDGM